MSPETQVYYQNGMTISGGHDRVSLTWPENLLRLTRQENIMLEKVDGEE